MKELTQPLTIKHSDAVGNAQHSTRLSVSATPAFTASSMSFLPDMKPNPSQSVQLPLEAIRQSRQGRPSRLSEIVPVNVVDPNVHLCVRTVDNKYKPCVYCQMKKRKTKNGWYIYSYYKCKACDIPLCTGHRNCFNEYHEYISGKDP